MRVSDERLAEIQKDLHNLIQLTGREKGPMLDVIADLQDARAEIAELIELVEQQAREITRLQTLCNKRSGS